MATRFTLSWPSAKLCPRSELKLYLLACSKAYLDETTKFDIYYDLYFLALRHGCRCQKLLNPKSFKTLSGQCGASQHQQVKFIRAYLDLGNVPIKQNRAVEQQCSGPLGARPNALRLKFTLL